MAPTIPRRRQGRCLRRIVAVVGAGALAAPCVRAFLPAAGRGAQPPARLAQELVLNSLGAAGLLTGAAAFPGQAAAADGADGGSPLPIIGGLLVLAAGAIAVLAQDPAKENVDDKKVVANYFNGEGFGRWQKIYGEKDDVNPVQMDIRVGHAQTLDKILGWLDGKLDGKSVCDAGCGTGNLSIPLAMKGAKVSGSDISSAMVGEASERAVKVLPKEQVPEFMTSDLESLSGRYDTVCCVDVLIHYPPEKMEGMVKHLSSLSKERLILSFAPKSWYYTALKNFGGLFPGPSKTTRAYLHEEEVVEDALRKAGFKVTRKEMTSTNFYFSRLFEAVPVA